MNNSDIKKLIGAWADYVEAQAKSGKRIYLVTMMFKPMDGTKNSMRPRMTREMERVYAILVTRMVRRPRSAAATPKLPIFIASLDRPVFKTKQEYLGDVRINDGNHLHAIGIMPPCSRLGCGLQKHFRDDQRLYVRGESKLARIHAVRIDNDLPGTVDYGLKGLKRSKDPDDWIILPKSKSELRKGRKSR